MAAVLTRRHRFQTSIHHFLKTNTKTSILNNSHSLQQQKWCSRPPNSFFRKTRELEIPHPRSLNFSSRTKPSSSNFAFVSWYLGMIHTRPIITKSVTASLIYTAADLSSQTIEGEPYCLMRTLRMAGYGMFLLGPSLHYWLTFLSKAFPGRDFLSTIKKVVLGQVTYGPAMTAIFFSMNAALQGETGSEIVARLKRDLLPTLINGVMYWPFCDFVTFKFIPVHLQPLVTNSFSYLWSIYMTYVANLAKVKVEGSLI